MNKSLEYYKFRLRELERVKCYMIKERNEQYKRFEVIISNNANKSHKIREKIKRLENE